MPALDEASSKAFPFIRDKLLAATLQGTVYRPPSPAQTAARCPSVKHARTLSMQVELTDSATVDAKTAFGQLVILTAGYLCECWCAAHLMLEAALTEKLAPNAPLIQVLPRGADFAWPTDAPLPTQVEIKYVAETNRMFPTIVNATLLHEIGHALMRDRYPSLKAEELACDSFAMKYLLGNRSWDGEGYRRLGIAIWLCGLCSQALTKDAYTSPTHPHPIARMKMFLFRHASHRPRTELESNIHLICASHVIKMARTLRPVALDDSAFRESQTFCSMLKEIRRFW